MRGTSPERLIAGGQRHPSLRRLHHRHEVRTPLSIVIVRIRLAFGLVILQRRFETEQPCLVLVAIGGIGSIVANSYIDARIKTSDETPAAHLIAFREEIRREVASIKTEIGKLEVTSGNNADTAVRIETKLDNVIQILLERQ